MNLPKTHTNNKGVIDNTCLKSQVTNFWVMLDWYTLLTWGHLYVRSLL